MMLPCMYGSAEEWLVEMLLFWGSQKSLKCAAWGRTTWEQMRAGAGRWAALVKEGAEALGVAGWCFPSFEKLLPLCGCQNQKRPDAGTVDKVPSSPVGGGLHCLHAEKLSTGKLRTPAPGTLGAGEGVPWWPAPLWAAAVRDDHLFFSEGGHGHHQGAPQPQTAPLFL